MGGIGDILPMLGLAVAGQAPYLAVIKWLVDQYQAEKKARAMADTQRVEEAKNYITKSHQVVLRLDQIISETHINGENLVNQMKLLKEDVKEYMERMERKLDDLNRKA